MDSTNHAEKGIGEIPGPWPSVPLIGTGWQYFPGSRYDLSKLHEASEDKYHRFGAIVKEEFQWGHPVVHLFDPRDFETVFKTQGQYPLRPVQEFLTHYRKGRPDKYDSAGLANEEGKEWEKLRKVIGPILLKPKAINFLMDSMNVIGDDFVSLLRSERDPDTMVIADAQELSYKFALEGVHMMSLDTRLGCLDPDPPEGSSASDMILSVKLLFEAFQELYFGLPLWKFFETASYKKLDKAESLMYSATSKQIRETVERLREFDAGDDDRVGVLQLLIQSGELSDKELVVTVIDLISGGIFTVANSLSFLLYHISKNPDVQEKLYQELMEVMPDSEVTNTRLGKMPYLKACVKEAFRLTPTIPAISRILPKDTILSGYKVPAGSTVFCNFPVPCMQEDKFPDPKRFYPDRWLDRSGNDPYILMPFGLGARMCVGKRFAEMEMYVALAKVVYNFKIEHIGNDIECKSAFIIVPSNPVSLVLRDR